jgi:hypothetical protein
MASAWLRGRWHRPRVIRRELVEALALADQQTHSIKRIARTIWRTKDEGIGIGDQAVRGVRTRRAFTEQIEATEDETQIVTVKEW